MNIQLNGETKMIQAASVAALVAELGLNPRQVAIEQNGAIVPRSTYGDAALTEGDRVEIVAFVGGG